MSETIKRCPCCGARAVAKKIIHKGTDAWIVECADCGGQTHPVISPEKAVEVWNRRAP